MQKIGRPRGPENHSLAAKADGTVIVGTSLTTGSTGSSHCFVWTAKTGMQDLKILLQAAGVHTADKWVALVELDGVSADGTVMVGYGQSPRTKAFPFGNWEPFRVVL